MTYRDPGSGRVQLVGIVSSGVGCGHPKFPGVLHQGLHVRRLDSGASLQEPVNVAYGELLTLVGCSRGETRLARAMCELLCK